LKTSIKTGTSNPSKHKNNSWLLIEVYFGILVFYLKYNINIIGKNTAKLRELKSINHLFVAQK